MGFRNEALHLVPFAYGVGLLINALHRFERELTPGYVHPKYVKAHEASLDHPNYVGAFQELRGEGV